MKKLFVICLLLSGLSSEAQIRLYLPSTLGTSDVTPAISGAWNSTGSSVVKALVKSRTGSASTNTAAITLDASSGTASTLFYQYVSAPLAAQTISGTVKAQIRMSISSATGTPARPLVVITVVNSAGVIQATLLAATQGNADVNAVATNRSIPVAGTALTSYSCNTGDRIVIEFGMQRVSGTTARTGVMGSGDVSFTEYPEDNTTTTSASSWIEFSNAFKFNQGILL